MSIATHHFIRIAIPTAILIAGMVVFALMIFRGKALLGIAICILAFIIYTYSGHKLTYSVPVQCPKCSGQAYAKDSPKGNLYYECTQCGHIEETGFSESSLND